MAIPFSRSLRSIQMDSMRLSLSGLIITILLLSAWLGWFFLASISINEISKDVTVDVKGEIRAKFPKAAVERIESGQNASIRIEMKNPASAQNGVASMPLTITFAGIVMKKPFLMADENGNVELASIDDRFYSLIQNGSPQTFKTEVEVEVERVTPFVLLQRASRQYFTSSQVDTSQLNLTQ